MSLQKCLHALRTQTPRRIATIASSPRLPARAFSCSAISRTVEIQPGAPIPDTPTPAPAATAAAPVRNSTSSSSPAQSKPQPQAQPEKPKKMSPAEQLASLPDGSVQSLYYYSQCYQCGHLGHKAGECKQKTPVCHWCHKPGHTGIKCPEPRPSYDEMRAMLLKSGAFQARFKGQVLRDVGKREEQERAARARGRRRAAAKRKQAAAAAE